MTAPTPSAPPLSWPLDQWALESLNEELQNPGLWTPDTAGDCANLMVRQLPAILAALTELEGLRAVRAAAQALIAWQPDVAFDPEFEGRFDALADALAAREAEEVSRENYGSAIRKLDAPSEEGDGGR